MAPAQQNVEMCDEKMQSDLKRRPASLQRDDVVNENNNKVLRDSDFDKVTSDTDFDISKYEAMEFTPQIKWPDLIVQISLHLVSIVGLYLIVSNQIRIYTTLFGKFCFLY